MSPFCPECFALNEGGGGTCSLDGTFFHERICAGCEGEVYPRELYCAECGERTENAAEHILIPPAASPWRLLGGLGLDTFSLCLFLAVGLKPVVGLLPMVVLVPLFCVLYRAGARSGGRQTLGQSVFHTKTTSSTGAPCAFVDAIPRTVLEYSLLPLLLKRERLENLEKRSKTLEVGLA